MTTKTASSEPDGYMTPREVTEDLQVPESTLAQWRWLKKGPPWIKVGRHVRYPRSGYRAWLAAGADSPTEAATNS
jgi:predicted DNA-binding transcriptional regulator AlpA